MYQTIILMVKKVVVYPLQGRQLILIDLIVRIRLNLPPCPRQRFLTVHLIQARKPIFQTSKMLTPVMLLSVLLSNRGIGLFSVLMASRQTTRLEIPTNSTRINRKWLKYH